MRFNRSKIAIINCPNCGYEYLPAEIYMPNDAFGRPGEILRDDSGKIIDFSGTTLDLKESYTCDKCGKTFNLDGKVVFKTEVDSELDFDEDYSCAYKPKKIVCKEDI